MTPQHQEDPRSYVQSAIDAIRKGEYEEAFAQVGHLEKLHGCQELAHKIRQEITDTENADQRDAARAPWYGAGIGFVLYLIVLLVNSPAGWGRYDWIPLAFFIIPAATGYATAFFYGFRCQRLERFWPSAWSGFGAMAAYSAIGMLVARHRIVESSASDAGGEFLAGLIAIVAYGVIAGIVAGLTGAARPYTLPNDQEDYSEFYDLIPEDSHHDEHIS
jgi:hypothetical protein